MRLSPDLVCCGKGISGSLPLSAVLGRGDLIDLDPPIYTTEDTQWHVLPA